MSESSHHFPSNVAQAYVNELAGSYFVAAQMYIPAPRFAESRGE